MEERKELFVQGICIVHWSVDCTRSGGTHSMGKRETRKTGKGVQSIAKNPLFRALNGSAPTNAKVASKVIRNAKQTTSGRANELALRLGLAKASKVRDGDSRENVRRVPAKKLNPLAAALSNKPRSVEIRKDRAIKQQPAPVKKKSVNRDDRGDRGDRGSGQRERRSFKNSTREYLDGNVPTQPRPVPSRNESMKQQPMNLQGNNHYNNSSYDGSRNTQTRSQDTQSRRDYVRYPSEDKISFRNASLIPFLRITNLEPDVSETDIRSVLTSTLGPTLKILKRSVLHNNKPSVCAEVFFLHEELLGGYAESLNNVYADGRLLKAEVSTKSVIIHSDKLWEGMLREVRFLKQEELKGSA